LFIHDSGGAGFRVVDPDNNITDGVLERSWIASSGTNGVSLDNAAGWQLRNLHIYGVARHAIDARRCFGTGINDNYIEDFGHQGTVGFIYYGIHCTVQGNVSNVISGNKVNQLHAIPAQGSFISIGLDGNYAVGAASVTSNAIHGTGNVRETGLAYNKGGATAMTVVSTGNQVNRVGTARLVGAGVTVTAGL
jgi:hypothetical protein